MIFSENRFPPIGSKPEGKPFRIMLVFPQRLSLRAERRNRAFGEGVPGLDQSWIGGIGGGGFLAGAGAAAMGGEGGGGGGAAAGTGAAGAAGGGAGVTAAAPGAGADLIAGVSPGFSARGGFPSCVANSDGRDRGNGGPLGAAG
jgi:hypothetical protein